MDSIQIPQPCTVISRRQFIINLGVSGIYSLINLTMKTPCGFKSINLGLVIGNHLSDSLLFRYNKAMYKILRI